jgi:glycosyltransferase involved in cell wall biosynthesis
MSYVVITPARDEARFIERTVNCMAAQTLRPTEWVVVNDGSTDETGAILDRCAREYDWLKVVHREDRGFRAAGGGVVEAVNAGLAALDTQDWEYLVKFDGDLSFEPDYFEGCLAEFAKDPTLGVGGGVIYNRIDGELVLEKHPRFHVRGATKIYRRACWDDIAPLIVAPGWDTLDEVKAGWKGWTTRSFDDPHLVQERFTGEAAGQWSTWKKNGRANYICGYHPLWLLARSVVRATRKPYLTSSFGLLAGYFGAWLRREPRIEDRDLIRYVRGQQLRRLFGRKSTWR